MSDNNQESTDDAQQMTSCSQSSTVSSGFLNIWYNGKRVREDPEMAEITDKFCCSQRSEKDPSLETTNKAVCKKSELKRTLHNRGRIIKPFTFRTPIVKVVRSEVTPFIHRVSKQSQQSENNSKSASSSISYPDIENTTFQSAKFPGKINSQSALVSLQSGSKCRKKAKPKVKELTKRHRPGCTEGTIREESQNRSDNAGTSVSSNYFNISDTGRFSLISPPSATDEQLKKTLTDIQHKVWDVHAQLEAADIEIIRFIQKTNMGKRPGNYFKIFRSEEPVLCILCETRIKTQDIKYHLKHCYKKYERKSLISEYTEMLHDAMWNVFCHHKSTRGAQCKNLKALCRLHGSNFRKDDAVCGYELARNVYCGSVGNTCAHVDWEVLKRAQLDLEKLNLIVKLKQLNEEEEKIKNEMASRGNLTV